MPNKGPVAFCAVRRDVDQLPAFILYHRMQLEADEARHLQPIEAEEAVDCRVRWTVTHPDLNILVALVLRWNPIADLSLRAPETNPLMATAVERLNEPAVFLFSHTIGNRPSYCFG